MKKGYFGEFGGCFVPELLMPPLQELEEAMRDIMPSPTFKEELDDLLRNFAGRETPLTYCPTLSKRLGFSLWLKREDLLHTGAHKVNNTLGRRCSPSIWAKRRWSRKPARASTAWRQPLPPPVWGLNASFSWVPRTWSASPPTCGA